MSKLAVFIASILLTNISTAQHLSDSIEYYLIEIKETDNDEVKLEYQVVNKNTSNKDESLVQYNISNLDSFIYILLNDLYNLPSEKNDVLLFIHGMWGSKGNALRNTIQELSNLFVHTNNSNIGRIISIQWPSNDWKYKDNKEKAVELSVSLSEMFTKLVRTSQILGYVNKKSDCKFHLMCHSLGNFLFKNMIIGLPPSENAFPFFDEVILAAADLDTDAFLPGHSMEKLRFLGNRVHIYYNRKDLTLKVSKDLNDKQRMGLVGLSKETPVWNNVHLVDVTAVNDDRNFSARFNKHFYYRTSPTVTSDMLYVFNNVRANEIPLRAKSKRQQVFLLIEEKLDK